MAKKFGKQAGRQVRAPGQDLRSNDQWARETGRGSLSLSLADCPEDSVRKANLSPSFSGPLFRRLAVQIRDKAAVLDPPSIRSMSPVSFLVSEVVNMSMITAASKQHCPAVPQNYNNRPLALTE